MGARRLRPPHLTINASTAPAGSRITA
jgi:hypothetical protein